MKAPFPSICRPQYTGRGRKVNGGLAARTEASAAAFMGRHPAAVATTTLSAIGRPSPRCYSALMFALQRDQLSRRESRMSRVLVTFLFQRRAMTRRAEKFFFAVAKK